LVEHYYCILNATECNLLSVIDINDDVPRGLSLESKWLITRDLQS